MRPDVVELGDGGVMLCFDSPGQSFAAELSFDEALELAELLRDGGAPPEGPHTAAGADVAQEIQGALGQAERGPERPTQPLERLVPPFTSSP
jgi:hypothetical protein